jgi:adenylate kinase family enzyme
MKFPIFKTKAKGVIKKFNLADPKERMAYFRSKAGPEIAKLRQYLKKNSFIAYFLGKKNSGKGTYSKMFAEIVGPEKISHFSIGDMVRGVDEELKNKKRKKELYFFLEKNYRGWLPFKKAFSALEKRNTRTLLPTELILALVKREILRRKKKTLFIDGFPRDLDQISYSLFFRDLIGYREDSDIFVLIDVPESVIDERIKWRRVCPKCQTSRNFKLLPTSKIGYDKQKKEFYLICDNPSCPASLSGRQGAEMIAKEGDKLGIAPIKERLELDERLIKQAFSLYGIPKIFLRNSLPVRTAKKFVDDYEITSEYSYQWDEKEKKVRIIEKPWIIPDDEGIRSYSLLAAPVTVSLIKQMAEALEL